MAKEIERKFLLKDLSVVSGLTGKHIVQGYLSAGRVVTRVRLIDDKSAFLTIKCPTLERGACDEFEYPIDRCARDALALRRPGRRQDPLRATCR